MMLRSSASIEGAANPKSTTARQLRAPNVDPVLLLLHQKYSCAGAVGNWLETHGYALDIRHPTLGDELPQTLQKHGGLIVFGGAMSANDEAKEITREIDWLSLTLEERTPFFGICLGAQMMVRALGGDVQPHKQGLVEIGYHRVTPTVEGQKLIEDWPEHYFQWHNEGFSLPSGAKALAHGNEFKNQFFSYDNHVFGLQFHPEVTRRIIRRWSRTDQNILTKKGAHNVERLLADHLKYKQAQRDWLHQFMLQWTSLIKPRENPTQPR